MGSALTRATYGNGSAVRETLSKSPTCPPFLFWRMSECDITGSACLTPVPDVGECLVSEESQSRLALLKAGVGTQEDGILGEGRHF